MAKWMVAVPTGVRERVGGGTRSRVARETGGRRSSREARSPQLPPLMSPHTNYLLILSPFVPGSDRAREGEREKGQRSVRGRETG